MSLDEMADAVESNYSGMDEHLEIELDRETKHELAMLLATLDTDDPDELLRRGIHLLFQTTVDSGKLDFHLRTEYDVTYDEYLAGMTYDDMGGGPPDVGDENDRRYRF